MEGSFLPVTRFLTSMTRGNILLETKLKGAFNGEPTSIAQFDSSNNKLPSDFMLTTGSKINVLVSLVVYDPKNGWVWYISYDYVRYRLSTYAEMKKRSAFDTVEGGSTPSERVLQLILKLLRIKLLKQRSLMKHLSQKRLRLR